MLILVGVTINVALNGGLFTQAQTAANDTQMNADKEQLLSAVVASYDIATETISESELRENLGNGWTVVKEGSVYKVTSPKGNVFTVDAKGNIDYKGKKTTADGETPETFSWETVGLTVDTNTEYIAKGGVVLRFSTDGKLSILCEGMNIITVDATDSKYISNGIIDFISEKEIGEMGKPRIKVEMNANKTDIDLTIICFKDDGITEDGTEVVTCEKISLEDEDIYTNEEVLQALGATGGEYKGTWTVIERDASGNPTKLVSTSAVTYCELGEEGNLEKCISDYKNAESILNTAAQKATGIESARSINIEDIYDIIGEENVDKSSSYGKKWNYYYENGYVYSKYQTGIDESGEIIWSEPHKTSYSSQTFVDDNGNTVVVDSEHDSATATLTSTSRSCSLTETHKDRLGVLSNYTIWLASPWLSCGSENAYFDVPTLSLGDDIGHSSGRLFTSSTSVTYDWEMLVFAVVSVSGL